MPTILLCDDDLASCERVAETLRRTNLTEVTCAGDIAELLRHLQTRLFAAVFIGRALDADQMRDVLMAVRTAAVRPLLVIAADPQKEELDPDLVSLVVRKPYEVPMVAGVLLAAITGVEIGGIAHRRAGLTPEA